jgi:hypothetical protein
MDLNTILFFIGLGIAFIFLVFIFPQWILLRTAPKVIRIFRENNAVGSQNAKTIEELGLKPKPMFERMLRRRDHKPRALQFLMRVSIVEITDEGKVYLDEEKLSQTRWRSL